MIWNLVQPSPMILSETGVSSVKHLWPATSHWQRLASPLPGNNKCGRTVSSADMKLCQHRVKQPHYCKPTNHPSHCVCLCSIMSRVPRPCPLFTQNRSLLQPREDESWLSYVWLSLPLITRLHCRQWHMQWNTATGNRLEYLSIPYVPLILFDCTLTFLSKT